MLGARIIATEPRARRRAHELRREVYPEESEREALFDTISGHEVRPLYTEEDRAEADEARDLGFPGSYPYTRGIYPSMYRQRLRFCLDGASYCASWLASRWDHTCPAVYCPESCATAVFQAA